MSLKQYFLSIMKDERKGPSEFFLGGVLYILSLIYGAALRIIDWAYRVGIRQRYKINVPVISVGNITLGGTGKTPFSIFLADHFQANGKKCAILTRGYGKDESSLFKDELASVSVFIGQDRVKSASLAASQGCDVIILDDAFQHRRLERSLDILLLDGRSMFGNGHLFPRGILRESVQAIKRADIFVLTKTDRLESGEAENIIQKLKGIDPLKPIIKMRHRITFLTDAASAAYAPEYLKGKKVLLVSGIADPDYFEFMVSREAAEIVSRRDYPDHHAYSQRDIDSIAEMSGSMGAESIIVTGKDYVKIKQLDISRIENKLFVLNIVMDITEGRDTLLARLNSVVSC